MEPSFSCRRRARCKDLKFAASQPAAHRTLCKYFKLPEYCFKLYGHVSLEEGILLEPTTVAVHMSKPVNVSMAVSVVIFGAGTVGLVCGAAAKAFDAGK